MNHAKGTQEQETNLFQLEVLEDNKQFTTNIILSFWWQLYDCLFGQKLTPYASDNTISFVMHYNRECVKYKHCLSVYYE
jgi:hypothetical protein